MREQPGAHVPLPAAGLASASWLRWRMLGAATVVQVTVAIMSQGVPTLAPYIQASLSLTLAQVGLFGAALNIGSALTVGHAGWLVDVLGERATMGLGGLFVAAMAALVLIFPYPLVLAAIFMVGIGVASSTPAGSKAVMNWFPVNQRGVAMGIRQTGIPLGGALAALVLPPIAVAYGWQAAVAAAGGLALAGGALAVLAYRDSSHVRPTGAARQLVPIRHVLTRDILLVGLMATSFTVAQFVTVTYLAIYLRETAAIAIPAGLSLLLLAQAAGTVGRIAWGGISDRLLGGRRRPALVMNGLVTCVATLALSMLPTRPSWALLVVVALVLGASAIGWNGLFITLASELADPDHQGRTVGVCLIFGYSGIILGGPFFGLIVDRTGSFRIAWLAVAAVTLLGSFLISRVRERPKGSTA